MSENVNFITFSNKIYIKRKTITISKYFKKIYNFILKNFPIVIIFLMIYYIIFRIKRATEKVIYESYKININNYFNNLLPKISLEKNNIPSLEEIFNSRILYISDANLTEKYIRYIRPINETEEEQYNKKYSEGETKISTDIFKKRADQYDYKDFAKLCLDKKLIDTNKIEYYNKPIISVILPTYNKNELLLKSIRSIQNQSFKNIEIIIVNDCSTDNSTDLFNYLLESDPRIRIFHHLKNLGCWRARMNGILYSRGKYLILFDPADLYEDNYVLEDSFNIIEKYNLDSAKFLFRVLNNYNNLNLAPIHSHVYQESKIIYGALNIEKYNNHIFKGWGNIWNRITRANIYIKGLYLLNNILLNIYKNIYDDYWLNILLNKVSFSFAVFERIGYLYFMDGNGVGSKKHENKDKFIQEYLGFLYFDYFMLPKNDSKSQIVKTIKEYGRNNGRFRLNFLQSKFYILNNLLNILIEDPYVSENDKNYLKDVLRKSLEKEKSLENHTLKI